jgi:hypothetical protein
MSFLTKTMTKELQSIPFDVAYRLFMDAADMAEQTLEAENTQRYDAFIADLERNWSDTHESPFEGNFSDQHPYKKHPDSARVRNKAGSTAIISEFIPRYKLDTILQTWVMPQIVAWLTHKPFQRAEILTVEGKISGRKMAQHIFDFNSEWDLGLYQLLMLDSRSSYISSQYKGEGRTYCSLVPLIPYAFKLNQSIKYSEWDRDTIKFVVNDSLCKAMLCEIPEMTREEILEARTQGLTYKTGSKAGTQRSPLSTFKLYDTTGTKLHKVPELAQTMIAQIWCAHPSNRTKYMILDPENWDAIPAPLISTDIFGNNPSSGISGGFPKPKSSGDNPDFPWL